MKKIKLSVAVWFVLALLIFAYSIKVIIAGNGLAYFGLCIMMGFACLIMGFLVKKGFFKKLPKTMKRVLIVILSLGVFCIVLVEGCILGQFGKEGEPELDYIIVLGARVRDDGLSSILAARCKAAIKYMEANPNTLCIVSGGQGENEPCTEAKAMADYMISKGIAKDRIILEEKANNTIENIANSRAIINDENASIGVVTSNFHLFRAMGIARAQGINEVSGISAYVVPAYVPEYLFREFFGVVKDMVKGNMKM